MSVLLLSLVGCGKGKKAIPGLENFSVHVERTHVYASFLATQLKWDAGITLPLPGLPGATLSAAPDFASSGTILQLTLPYSALSSGSAPNLWKGLPDGRPLPDITGGKLPARGVKLGSLGITLYLSPEVFAIHVPIPLKAPNGSYLPVTLSSSLYDSRGNRIGKIYAVGASSATEQTGVLLTLPLVLNKLH